MKRREFSSGLLAAGLAAPPVLGPTSALANVKEEDGTELERFARMQLTLATQTVAITWLLFMFPVILGLNYQRTIPRYLLQRAAAGGILFGLQHTPFSRRFKGSILLGNVVLLSSMLLILPLLRRPPEPGKVYVANSGFEYAHPGTPDPVKINGLPNRSRLDRLPVIATARVNDKGEVGVVVPPLKIDLKF